jgi:hypothetical protein
LSFLFLQLAHPTVLWTILSSFPRGHWSHEGGWENSAHERDIERNGCGILTREDNSTPRVILAGYDKDVVLMTEVSGGEILNQGQGLSGMPQVLTSLLT